MGVVTALLLCALGVHRDVIREDFIRSNVCLAGELDYMLRYLEANRLDSIANVNKVSALFRVKDAAFINFLFRSASQFVSDICIARELNT